MLLLDFYVLLDPLLPGPLQVTCNESCLLAAFRWRLKKKRYSGTLKTTYQPAAFLPSHGRKQLVAGRLFVHALILYWLRHLEGTPGMAQGTSKVARQMSKLANAAEQAHFRRYTGRSECVEFQP